MVVWELGFIAWWYLEYTVTQSCLQSQGIYLVVWLDKGLAVVAVVGCVLQSVSRAI